MERDHDAVIVGAGHNGLVAACYLALAGKRVLLLERGGQPGGATVSHRVFEDHDALLSRYSYLVSLFPRRIMRDLGLDFRLLPRAVSSYTPDEDGGGLLLRSGDDRWNRGAIESLGTVDYRGYQLLEEKQQAIASLVWDSLLEPLESRQTWRSRFSSAGQSEVWRDFVEAPLGEMIERHLGSDLLRGILLTDAKIGANTFAHDASLLQNRTFLYHVIGNLDGQWLVPEGGMGAVTGALMKRARELGVEWRCGCEVTGVGEHAGGMAVEFSQGDREEAVTCRDVLWNAMPPWLRDHGRCAEGTAFKINLLVRRLPRLRDPSVRPEDAFAGTFHIDEGYERLEASYRDANAGKIPERVGGEIYCHTLTDRSILGREPEEAGWHTLTWFGLDLPYPLFERQPEATKGLVVERFLAGINRHLDEPIESCLAVDRSGVPCLEAKSALDLEQELGLPRGNIFHTPLAWFHAETGDEVGTYGVETNHDHQWLCGSSARRGGAVSGIPGRNAAVAVLKA